LSDPRSGNDFQQDRGFPAANEERVRTSFVRLYLRFYIEGVLPAGEGKALLSSNLPRASLALTSLFVCFFLSLCAGSMAQRTPSRATGLLLAEKGKALLPVVVSAKASPGTRAVAAELAAYLQRITGAVFTVQTGESTRGIVVGTLAEFPNATLRKPFEIQGFDGREAYAIRTDAKRLRLLGATDLGVSHAAFRFLETLGCRWFFPAPE
jgi:hypothetical protein